MPPKSSSKSRSMLHDLSLRSTNSCTGFLSLDLNSTDGAFEWSVFVAARMNVGTGVKEGDNRRLLSRRAGCVVGIRMVSEKAYDVKITHWPDCVTVSKVCRR